MITPKLGQNQPKINDMPTFERSYHVMSDVSKVFRPVDILFLLVKYQTELAKTLKFKRTNGQEPVETFLGELHARMEFIKQQHLMFLEQGYLKKPKRKSKRLKYKKDEGLKVKKGMLRFRSLESVLDSPKLIIKIFEESARLKIPLSAEAKRIVNEFGYLVDDKFRTSTYVVKSFERILSAPGRLRMLNA